MYIKIFFENNIGLVHTTAQRWSLNQLLAYFREHKNIDTTKYNDEKVAGWGNSESVRWYDSGKSRIGIDLKHFKEQSK